MRVTVCELPHEPALLETAWAALREHTTRERTELLLLPEFAFVEPLWLAPEFDAARWADAVAQAERWLDRLPELGAGHVVGARPVTQAGVHLNQGFAWSNEHGARPLRSKHHLPDEPGGWEARWFDRGDAQFPRFEVGGLSFGLNICTELWALDTYASYAAQDVAAILSPRATAGATTAKWLAVGTVAAVRSGAYSISSNRVSSDGACGGVGWIIDPDGALLARTSASEPFQTRDIDLAAARAARATYPRYVFQPAR